MKVLILYRERSEHARAVEMFMHDFARLHPEVKLEPKEIDSREGAVLAETYNIVAYPGFIAIQDDGSVLQSWQGEQLPLMNDVASYALA